MPSTIHQEDIHISYITALCASADISYEKQWHDDDGTDGIIKKRIDFPDGGFFDSQLRIQLKSTSSPSQYTESDDMISYRLKPESVNFCTVMKPQSLTITGFHTINWSLPYFTIR